MHPNPACIYKNEYGESIAEDEEGCLEEYKRKGFVAGSSRFPANFQCESPFHNRESPAYPLSSKNISDLHVIGKGTIVNTFAVRCNGVAECFNAADEVNCSIEENSWPGKKCNIVVKKLSLFSTTYSNPLI